MLVYNNSLSPLSTEVIHDNYVRYLEHGCLSVHLCMLSLSLSLSGVNMIARLALTKHPKSNLNQHELEWSPLPTQYGGSGGLV